MGSKERGANVILPLREALKGFFTGRRSLPLWFGRFLARKDSARRAPPGWRSHNKRTDFGEPL